MTDTTVRPFLMFEGRAEEAMNAYVALFDDGAIEEIRRYIGATSLGYLTLEDLEMSVTAPGQYCYACWTGKYPIPVPEVSSSVPFDVD